MRLFALKWFLGMDSTLVPLFLFTHPKRFEGSCVGYIHNSVLLEFKAYTFVSLNSRLERNKEEEEDNSVAYPRARFRIRFVLRLYLDFFLTPPHAFQL